MTTESAQLQNASDERLDALDACELAEHDRDGYRLALSRERGEHRATWSALIDARRRADASESALSMLRATLERERGEHRDTRRALELVEKAFGAAGLSQVEIPQNISLDTTLPTTAWFRVSMLMAQRDDAREELADCRRILGAAERESPSDTCRRVLGESEAVDECARAGEAEIERLTAANSALTDEIDRLILDRAEWMRRAEYAEETICDECPAWSCDECEFRSARNARLAAIRATKDAKQ
jgi:hypothetical protein